MEDYSYLDKQYFIDQTVYNCPFCNRKNVHFEVVQIFSFDWTAKKKCYGFLAKCSFCKNKSMHLSFEEIVKYREMFDDFYFRDKIRNIDSKIFYSVPTSFFVLDSRIPQIVRELITESEGCLKMNYLTGASACMRKAIYELVVIEKAEGEDYESKIKALKKKYPESDPTLFDILSHIQDMTSDKIHEQSWDRWNSKNLKLIIETLKTVLYDIYVIPKIKAERSKIIQQMRAGVKKDKKQ
jgi:transcription elongation factor Elf1